jgi:hypothetical protein
MHYFLTVRPIKMNQTNEAAFITPPQSPRVLGEYPSTERAAALELLMAATAPGTYGRYLAIIKFFEEDKIILARTISARSLFQTSLKTFLSSADLRGFMELDARLVALDRMMRVTCLMAPKLSATELEIFRETMERHLSYLNREQLSETMDEYARQISALS